jgi:hypothetical protein
MKKIIATLTITSAIFCSFAIEAQTIQTNSPSPLQGLINSGTAWLTTPDTNNVTLESTHFRVETGPAIQSGLTISDNLFAQYNFTSNRLAMISETRNASIGGTIVSEEVGIGYNLYQKYDTEITVFAVGGYRFDTSHDVFSVGATVRHMLNKVLYIAPGIQLDFGKKTLPMVTAYAGIAF